MKLTALLPAADRFVINGIKPSKSNSNIFVVDTNKGKFACGAKALAKIDVVEDGATKYLAEGTYKTFESGGVNWLASVGAEVAIDLS